MDLLLQRLGCLLDSLVDDIIHLLGIDRCLLVYKHCSCICGFVFNKLSGDFLDCKEPGVLIMLLNKCVPWVNNDCL